MRRIPATASGAALAALLLSLCAVSLATGAVAVPATELAAHVITLLGGDTVSALAPHQHAVLFELRLPRTLMAVCVGCILAQCGAVMQGVFRNPLADPGVIGVAAGAAVGAVLAIYLLPAAAAAWAVPVGAFIAGLLASIGVYRIACSPYGTSVLVLLLAGIAVSALAGSVIGLISYLADDSRLRDITLWQMGSVAGASMAQVSFCFGVLLLLAWRFQCRAAALNALLLGEAEARHLGIDVEVLKRELIVLVALGMGLAVASAGVIGFIGLVVPHIVRTLFGPDNARLLPLAGLAGGLLLLVADIGSRLLIQPAELPVGLLTALLGAPFFILLLLEQKGRG